MWRVGQPFTICGNGTVGAVWNWQHFRHSTSSWNTEQARHARQATEVIRGKNQRAVVGPLAQIFRARLMRDAIRLSAAHRQCVDVTVAFIAANKGDCFSIPRKFGHAFGTGRACERPRHSTIFVDKPQVICKCKNNVAWAKIRVAQHGCGRRLRWGVV